MSQLIYRNPGNAYASAVVCTLEGEQIVIRDGSGVTRLEQTEYVKNMIRGNCMDFDVELGPVGLEYRAEWIAQMEAQTARVMDAPDFDEETGVGNAIGSELHKLMARHGIKNHYGYAAGVLGLEETPSFAALTADEVNAVKDAIFEGENAVLEVSHIPEAKLTNPVHGSFRISLDPNQSGVSARARRGLGL